MPAVDRERTLRTLTFWLRPYFVLRVANRFQAIAGFDRAVALASSALTATIPVAVIAGVVAEPLGVRSAADRMIERYDLTGGGAQAVRDVFAPPSGTTTSLGIVGALFLLLAVLSFARAVQRMIEQTWELRPLGVRNSRNDTVWAGLLLVYLAVSGLAHVLVGRGVLDLVATVLLVPFTAVFLIWSGRLLSGGRLPSEALTPFGVLGAILMALYSVGASVYVPHMLSTYASRYGVIGAVFAMISALFCVMMVLVASAAAGREVHDELGEIRAGRRPHDDEVRRQWQLAVSQAKSRWQPRRRGGASTTSAELP